MCVFGGFAGVAQQVALQLLKAIAEEGQLGLVHVILFGHLKDLLFGEQRVLRRCCLFALFRCHFACSRGCGFLDCICRPGRSFVAAHKNFGLIALAAAGLGGRRCRFGGGSAGRLAGRLLWCRLRTRGSCGLGSRGLGGGGLLGASCNACVHATSGKAANARRVSPGACLPWKKTWLVYTRHCSRPVRNVSRGKSFPMKTSLLPRASPSCHGAPMSVPMIWCTPWKMTLRSAPSINNTPL